MAMEERETNYYVIIIVVGSSHLTGLIIVFLISKLVMYEETTHSLGHLEVGGAGGGARIKGMHSRHLQLPYLVRLHVQNGHNQIELAFEIFL